MPITYLASMTNILRELLEEYGHDPKAFFDRMGVDMGAARQPGARIPYETYAQLWTEATKLVDDPCFVAKAAEHYHPSYMHALGYAWMASSTLREAFGRMERYTRVISDAAMVICTDEGSDFSVELKSRFESAHLEITMIVDMLPSGSVTIGKMADRLNMSIRSLQRELARHEKTFIQLLAEIRLHLAEGYLKDPGNRLEEIAFMLGFSEYSTFSRFVKKHTQYSPSSFREKLITTVLWSAF